MIYVLLNTGLSTSFTSRFFQIGGLLASFFTVSKFCAEWHLFTGFSVKEDHVTKIPPDLKSVVKAMLFFGPHVIFRITSIAFLAAFFRFYTFILISIFVIIMLPIVSFYNKGEIKVASNDSVSNKRKIFYMSLLPISICIPPSIVPYEKSGRITLKIALLISSLLLLPCIILIRLLPLLPTSTIHCTLGLSHINLNSEIPSCSPCFNPVANNLTTANINDFTLYYFLAPKSSTGDCLT